MVVSGAGRGVARREKWKGGISEVHKETSEGDGYSHYLDCSDGFMSVTFVKTSSRTL